ncbi:MAG: hypothetical protein WBF90_33975 [Rivularia sp. (in: cyanobacteria)]
MTGKSFTQVAADFVVGRLNRDRHYYDSLARQDARYRRMSFREYGEAILSSGYDSLPKRVPDSMSILSIVRPLQDVVVPADNLVEANLARVPLGNLNYALLLNAIDYEPYSRRSYLSLILFDHIKRRWSERFAYQIEMEDITNWA